MSAPKKSAPVAAETLSQDPLPTPHVSVGPDHRVGAHDTGVNVLLPSIQLDTTIQCRADIDIATVNEYAEAMREGVEFPPVELFGTDAKCWIGDGWHRVMAARSVGAAEIAADLRPGGKSEALRFALSANAVHGRRRTNKDKRCAVAIALREYADKSDRAIAEMCAVSDRFVADMRRALNPGANGSHLSTRTGRDGKKYKTKSSTGRVSADERTAQIKELAEQGADVYTIARKLKISMDRVRTLARKAGMEVHGMTIATAAPRSDAPAPSGLHLPEPGPPRNGMQFARMAVMDLEQIRPDDLERDQAIRFVRRWLDEHRAADANTKGATPCPGSR